MITRTIARTIATINCADGYTETRTFYGAGVTATKIRKSFLAEQPEREITSMSINADEIKVGMTDAEFVEAGKEIK